MLTTHSSRQVAFSSMPSSWTAMTLSPSHLWNGARGDDLLDLLECQIGTGALRLLGRRLIAWLISHGVTTTLPKISRS